MAIFTATTYVDMRTLSFYFPESYGSGQPAGTYQTDTVAVSIDDWGNPIVEGTETYGGSFEYTVTNPATPGALSGRVTSYTTDREETWETNPPEMELFIIKYQMSGFDVDVSTFLKEPIDVLRTIFSGDDQISGRGTLLGFDGDDNITGSSSRDIIDGGKGADHMIGGGGSDIFYVDHVGDVVEGSGQVNSSISYTLTSDIYKLTLAGSLAINGVGNDLWNILQGSNGENTLHGRLGNDTLQGRGGNDILSGGYGDDILTGGEGADKLYGGAGADTFVFQWQEHSDLNARDTIYDFSQSQGDKIDLKAIDARVAAPSNQTFTFIGTEAFHEKAGELRFSVKEGKTYVHGDTDGDGAIDFTFKLDKEVNLTASDFIL
ncbi:calcium-binding protein [Shinella kummerowiae]|uniref:calcium-binding protein n=1 Tax=Shinella kummerowiae TaxID=417745 RepID=UPI0021B6C7A4|nr:calcium-binding protein [Shinella kummerowiae]MCT7665494.1 hypothetical protein [Shinella kummerowiae]